MTMGAVAGQPGGGQGPWGAALPQPKQATLPCETASQPGKDHRQAASKLTRAALRQPESDTDSEDRGMADAQAEAETSSIRPVTSPRSSDHDLMGLQTSYAMRLKQQQKGGLAAQLHHMHSSPQRVVEPQPSAHTGQQPDPCSTAGPAGSSSPRAQRCEREAAAQVHSHRIGGGRLEVGSSLGLPPNSPGVVTPRSCLFTSPKRSMGSHEEEAITILSDSQSQEELEISLSPSPAKRYANMTLACHVYLQVCPYAFGLDTNLTNQKRTVFGSHTEAISYRLQVLCTQAALTVIQPILHLLQFECFPLQCHVASTCLKLLVSVHSTNMQDAACLYICTTLRYICHV